LEVASERLPAGLCSVATPLEGGRDGGGPGNANLRIGGLPSESEARGLSFAVVRPGPPRKLARDSEPANPEIGVPGTGATLSAAATR
jgi:hypothetical protein